MDYQSISVFNENRASSGKRRLSTNRDQDKSPILARRRLKSDHLLLDMPGNFNLISNSKKFTKDWQSEKYNSNIENSKNSPFSKNGDQSFLQRSNEKKKQLEKSYLEPVIEDKVDVSESVKSFDDFPPTLKLKKIESEQYDLKDYKGNQNDLKDSDDDSSIIFPIKEVNESLQKEKIENSFLEILKPKPMKNFGLQCDLIKVSQSPCFCKKKSA